MSFTAAVLVALVAVGTAQSQTLPAPLGLRVENLAVNNAEIVTVSVAKPRFSFIPHVADTERGVQMSSYHIVVQMSNISGPVVWDSDKVTATSGISIKCGATLKALNRYVFSVVWGSDDGRISSAAKGIFEVGPMSEIDWSTAPWVGEGQNEFELEMDVKEPTQRIRMYVASPGGVIVKSDGVVLGDASGISEWIDFAVAVNYETFALPTTAGKHTIHIYLGNGFFTSNHSCKNGPGHIASGGFCGVSPAARILITSENDQRFVSKVTLVNHSAITRTKTETKTATATATATEVDKETATQTQLHTQRQPQPQSLTHTTSVVLSGRVGAVVSDDPFDGTVTDWSLAADVGWGPATTATVVPPGRLRALSVEHSQTSGSASAKMTSTVVSVTQLTPSKWHYTFSHNVVGQVFVAPGSYSRGVAANKTVGVEGKLILTHCEIMNGSECGALRGLPAGTGQDVHVLGNNNNVLLRPFFTWHGFQHVIVETVGGATFVANKESLSAVWTAANIAESATISFSGPGAELLSSIRDITKASQLANVAGYIPTDCPTREKHGWLGDAQVTAEEAMYNLWSPSLFESYLDVIRSNQNANTSDRVGFGLIPVVVPAALPPAPGDISWTSAYPLIAGWLYEYYGDLSVVRDHWSSLKDYMQGQKRAAGVGLLPMFSTFGDWCAIEPRVTCTKGTGPPASAANYILAVQAMLKMAEGLNEQDDVKTFKDDLNNFRQQFDTKFWNQTMGTYSNKAIEAQALSSIALGAGVVPQARQLSVVSALTHDIKNRSYHLTVGSAGQKWLLRTLTAVGDHDVALRLATQTTYPSWGYWISQGATSCWENWSGFSDGSHPGSPGNPNQPTHNHIFLCGGVGEWMYRSLGGISAAAPGYTKVNIEPQVSKTLGPNGVSASVSTVSGVVGSNWSRHILDEDVVHDEGCVVEVCASVAVGMTSAFSIPLLSTSTTHISVTESVQHQHQHQQPIWSGSKSGSGVPSSATTNGNDVDTGVDVGGVGVGVDIGVDVDVGGVDVNVGDGVSGGVGGVGGEKVVSWLLSKPTVSVGADGNARLAVATASGKYCFCVHHHL